MGTELSGSFLHFLLSYFLWFDVIVLVSVCLFLCGCMSMTLRIDQRHYQHCFAFVKSMLSFSSSMPSHGRYRKNKPCVSSLYGQWKNKQGEDNVADCSCLVAQSCLTLSDPMDYSKLVCPLLHCPLEFPQCMSMESVTSTAEISVAWDQVCEPRSVQYKLWILING